MHHNVKVRHTDCGAVYWVYGWGSLLTPTQDAKIKLTRTRVHAEQGCELCQKKVELVEKDIR